MAITCIDCGTQEARRGHYHLRCRPCATAHLKALAHGNYERNKPIRIERARRWKAAHPETVRESSRRRYAKNPGRMQAASDAWRLTNPARVRDIRENRRARERAAFVEDVMRSVVYAAFDGQCGICKEPVEFEKMQLDHIQPLSRGGLHAYSNVQPSHEFCNKSKGASVAS